MSVLRCSFGFEAKQAAAESSSGGRSIEMIAATGSLDRYGDRIEPAGIALDAYRRNPVILFNHSFGMPIARAEDIGMASGRLMVRAKFPDAGVSADSDKIHGLIRAGILNSASVALRPVESKPLDKGGRHYLRSELLEVSVVSVPGNAEAEILTRTWSDRDLEHELRESFGVSKLQARRMVAARNQAPDQVEEAELERTMLVGLFSDFRDRCRGKGRVR